MKVISNGEIVFTDRQESAFAATLDAMGENQILDLLLLKDEFIARFWRKLQAARAKAALIKQQIALRQAAADKLTDEERQAVGIDERGVYIGSDSECCYEDGDEYAEPNEDDIDPFIDQIRNLATNVPAIRRIGLPGHYIEETINKNGDITVTYRVKP